MRILTCCQPASQHPLIRYPIGGIERTEKFDIIYAVAYQRTKGSFRLRGRDRHMDRGTADSLIGRGRVLCRSWFPCGVPNNLLTGSGMELCLPIIAPRMPV